MKKFLSLLLIACMMLSIMPAYALATDDGGVSFSDDSNSNAVSADRKIGTAEELLAFAAEVNGGNTYDGKTVVLTDNIDLSSVPNWTPIGNATNYFRGTFEGQKYTISNMTINVDDSTTTQNVGLFGVTQNADIKNLTVKNVNITAVGKTVRAAAVVGYASRDDLNLDQVTLSFENIKVENCTITAEAKSGSASVAGVAGYSYPANMTNISVTDLTLKPKASSNVFTGAIVGYQCGQNISNNGNTRIAFTIDGLTLKNITIESETVTILAGGYAGYTYYGFITVKNVNIDGFKVDVTNTTSDACIGGLVGLAHRSDKGHTITDVEITGIDFDVTNAQGDTCAGGVVGYSGSPAAFSDCSVSGTITESSEDGATTKAEVGGFVGAAYSYTQTYTDCVADVDIDVTNIAGGFVGNNSTTATYTNCEASGTVSGSTAGGFAGNANKGTYKDCTYTGESDVSFIGGTSTGATIVNYVAQVGETQYESLQAAIDAADGETVTVLTAIELTEGVTVPAGKTVTLDLNGKTVSATHGSDYAMIHVQNGATLTIEGEGKITYAAGGDKTGAAVWVEGSLIQSGGTIELTGSWDFGFAVDVRPNAWGTAYTEATSFVMNDGTINATDTAVRVASNSSDNYEELGVSFTMNGGEIDSDLDAIFVQHLYAGDLNVKVVNGTVSGENSVLRVYGNAGSDVDMNIEGGTFTGEVKVAEAYAEADPIAITGGTWSTDVSAYVANGYEQQEDGNGTYGIVVDLPEVVITDIKNTLTSNDPDLTFALNFAIKDVENLSEEYLNDLMNKYGNYYVDYVLTISGLTDADVTFNSNGNADGYLAGQYDAWGSSWVSVPFEDVTVANGESLYIMEYAAKLMGQSGLRFTLAEVAAIVQNFDCGVYFTPEFLVANPELKVTLQLKVFTEDADGNKIENIDVATNEFNVENVVAIVCGDGKQTQYYGDLSKALEAAATGDTVKLVADTVEETYVIVYPGVTLDLNGKTLKAGYVVGFNGSDVIDSSAAKTGKLVVTKKNVVLDKANDMLPIYDGEGYVFVGVSFNNDSGSNRYAFDSSANKYAFSPLLGENADARKLSTELLADGFDSSNVKVVVRVTWSKDAEYVATQDYAYLDTMLASYVNSLGAENEDKYASMLSATFTTADMMKATDVIVSAVIISETGVEIEGGVLSIDVQ